MEHSPVSCRLGISVRVCERLRWRCVRKKPQTLPLSLRYHRNERRGRVIWLPNATREWLNYSQAIAAIWILLIEYSRARREERRKQNHTGSLTSLTGRLPRGARWSALWWDFFLIISLFLSLSLTLPQSISVSTGRSTVTAQIPLQWAFYCPSSTHGFRSLCNKSRMFASAFPPRKRILMMRAICAGEEEMQS